MYVYVYVYENDYDDDDYNYNYDYTPPTAAATAIAAATSCASATTGGPNNDHNSKNHRTIVQSDAARASGAHLSAAPSFRSSDGKGFARERRPSGRPEIRGPWGDLG